VATLYFSEPHVIQFLGDIDATELIEMVLNALGESDVTCITKDDDSTKDWT
jgi:hypothetical protein